MNIKRFFGKNSRTALAQVRQALGDNAVIISNRAVDGGNEIMAFSEDDIDLVPSHMEQSNLSAESVIEDAQNSSLEALFRKRMQAELVTEINDKPTEAASLASESLAVNINADVMPSAVPAVIQSELQATNTQIASMMQEIRNMRSMIESQLAEISWNAIQHRDPVKSSMLGKLLSAGFSASLSKQLAENIPAKQTEAEASKWMQSVLLRNLQTLDKEDEMLAEGGIFALIGPTGVGKTTTTAKLAARYVMKHGTEKIGLITTDSYRIGGHEQLRIYGKILGVMVHSVKDEAELKIALNELKNKHTILIDTVGVSQRDQMVSEQIAMLSNNNTKIKKLLCLNATNTGDTLVDVVRAYKGRGLEGCIMTKMDEAITVGNVLDVVIREKLKLYYVADGQRVPEDLHIAQKQSLIERAFSQLTQLNSPFQYQNEDLPFVIGNAVNNSVKAVDLEFDHV